MTIFVVAVFDCFCDGGAVEILPFSHEYVIFIMTSGQQKTVLELHVVSMFELIFEKKKLRHATVGLHLFFF